MLDHVSKGQKFKPKAADTNAVFSATRWVMEQQHKSKTKRQSVFDHPNVVWVKNIDEEVAIPRFGFAHLKEPLFLPEDEASIKENHNRICFKVDGNIENPGNYNYKYFTDYKHYGIVLEEAPVYDPDHPERSYMVPCVIDGLCWCKAEYGGDAGDPDSANHYPTTVWPRGSGSGNVGLALGGGQFPIIWRSETLVEDDGDYDYLWTLVKVSQAMDEPTFIMGNVVGDVAIDATQDVLLGDDISGVTTVPVLFPFFSAEDGTYIGACWNAQTDTYVAIARKCEFTDDSDTADGGNASGGGDTEDGGTPALASGDLDGGTP